MLRNFVTLCSIILFNNFLFAEELDFKEISNELRDATNELQEELSSLEDSDLNEAVIVDSALANMKETIQFLENSVENQNLDQALTTLKFLEKNLGVISSVIPAEIYNDMSSMNTESFAKEDLLAIQKISKVMNKKQDEAFKEMVTNMMTLEDHGFNAFSVVNNLNDLGVDVGEINVKLDSATNMKEWSKEEWANSWIGEVPKQRVGEITNEDGTLKYVDLSNTEITEMKAQMAMNFAGDVGYDINASNTNILTIFEGKQIILSGIDHIAATKALDSLDKSEAEWAAMWTSEDVATHKMVGNEQIELTAEEIQATHAEWAKNRAAQTLMQGKSFSDLNFNQNEITQATTFASENMQEQISLAATKAAKQAETAAENIENFDTSSVASDLVKDVQELITNDAYIGQRVASGKIVDVEGIEALLDVSIEAIISDTSNWTDQQWADSWIGDVGTSLGVCDGGTPYKESMGGSCSKDQYGQWQYHHTEAEANAIKAKWAKNRASQCTGNC